MSTVHNTFIKLASFSRVSTVHKTFLVWFSRESAGGGVSAVYKYVSSIRGMELDPRGTKEQGADPRADTEQIPNSYPEQIPNR